MSDKISFNDLIDKGSFDAGIRYLVENLELITVSIKESKEAADEFARAMGLQLKKEIGQLSATSKQLAKDMADMEAKMQQFKQTTSNTNKVISDYEKENERLRKELEKLKTAIDQVNQATDKTKKSKASATIETKRLAQSMLGLASGAALVYRGIEVLRNQLVLAVRSMLEFEQAMKEVQAISRASAEDLKSLTENANRLGATTEKTAGQIAQLQKELGKLGFNTTEILASTDAIVDLSTATGEDLAGSATVAAATLRAFGLEATEMGRVVDVMAGSFVRSGLDLEKFRESMKLVAPIASATGVEIEVTTAALSKLADAGLSGSLAGTALRNLLSSMADPSEKLTKFLGNLNNELADGVKSSDDLVLAFKELKTSGLQLADAVQMVDVRARPAFFTLLNQADAVEGLTLEYQDLEGEAARIATMMRDTLSNDIKIAESAFDAMRRNLVEQFTPSMREGTQGVTLLSEALRFLISDLAETSSNFKDNNTALVDWITGASQAKLLFGGLVDVIKENVKVSQFEELGKNMQAREQSVKQAAISARKEIAVYSALKKSFDDGKDFVGIKSALSNLGSEYDYLLKKITDGGEDEQKIAKRLFIQLEKNLQSRKGTIQQQKIALDQAKGELTALELAGVHTGKLGEEEVAKARMLEEQVDSLQSMVDEYSSLESKLVDLLDYEKTFNDYDIDALDNVGKTNEKLKEQITLQNQLAEAKLKTEVDALKFAKDNENDPESKVELEKRYVEKTLELAQLKYNNELKLIEAIYKDDATYLDRRTMAFQKFTDDINGISMEYASTIDSIMQKSVRATESAFEKLKEDSKKNLLNMAKDRRQQQDEINKQQLEEVRE